MNLNFDEMMYLAENKQELTAKREVVDGVPVVIFSYHVAFTDTFDSPLAKEFRGTTFREDTKECICRPFPKFFNVGERPDTQVDKINWDNAKFYTKHDGSMITPVLINGKVFLKTKKSFYSDVALKAQAFYDKNEDGYFGSILLKEVILPIYTPIYEYCGPNNQIVLPYEKEQFVFLGSRELVNGVYQANKKLAVSMASYEDIQTLENIEGYVIDDGKQLVKAKTAWYMARHKIASDFNPKAIIQATLDGTIDDILGMISQLGMTLRYHQVCELRDKVLTEYFTVNHEVDDYWKSVCYIKDRKEFALTVQDKVPQVYRGIMFALKDDKKCLDKVDQIVYNRVYQEMKG